MEIIEIQTLIDITNTRVVRLNQGSQLELDQNRNFITLMQCIEIRSIVSYDSPPTCETVDVKDMGFGSKYKGKHKVWTFRLYPDRSGAYLDTNNNPVGSLVADIDGVPVIQKLTETINIDKAIFNCKDDLAKNILIMAPKSTI